MTPGDTFAIGYGVQNSSTVVGIGRIPSRYKWSYLDQDRLHLDTRGPSRPRVVRLHDGRRLLRGLRHQFHRHHCGLALKATSGMMTAVTWTNSSSGWVANDLITQTMTQNFSGWAKAIAVNDSGVAVGESTYVNSPSLPSVTVHAVIFQNGNPVTLGTFGDGNNNDCANGINDSGVVVGQSSDSDGNPIAFIWDSVSGFRNMNAVYGPTGYNVIPSGRSRYNAVSMTTVGTLPVTRKRTRAVM